MVHPTLGPGVVTRASTAGLSMSRRVVFKSERLIAVRFDRGEVHQYTLASASKLIKLESEVSAEPTTRERRATEHEELERELAAEREGEADRLAATPAQCAWAQPWQSRLVWEASDSVSPALKALSPVLAAPGSPRTAGCLVRDVLTEVEHLHFVDDESDNHRPINRKNVHPSAAAPASSEAEADLVGIGPGSMTSPPV